MRDPVLQQTYRMRSLFDLRPIHGRQALWHEVAATVTDAVDRDFLRLLAHDCLSSLPPRRSSRMPSWKSRASARRSSD